MTTLLNVLLALSLAFFPQSSLPLTGAGAGKAAGAVPVTFVNVATGTGNASAASIASGAASHTAGNYLAVFVDYDSDGTNQTRITSCTDTATNTYTRTTGVANATSLDGMELWGAKNILGNASNVVTCNFSPDSAFRTIQVLQYAGPSTSSPVDVFNSGTGTGTGASTPSLVTTAGGVIVAAATANAGAIWTAGSGYTFRITVGSDNSFSEDQIHAASGTFTVTGTSNSPVNWSMLSVALK